MQKLFLDVILFLVIASEVNVQTEGRLSRHMLFSTMVEGIAVAIVFNDSMELIPTEVTEDVTVIASQNMTVLGESQYGLSVSVPECSAKVDETVSATFTSLLGN